MVTAHDPNQLPSPTTPTAAYQDLTGTSKSHNHNASSRVAKSTTHLAPTSLLYDHSHELEVSIHRRPRALCATLRMYSHTFCPHRRPGSLSFPSCNRLFSTWLRMADSGQGARRVVGTLCQVCSSVGGIGQDSVSGSWFDFTDPASGYPILSQPGPSLYPDVHGAQALLHYDVMNVGCCKVLLHPRWSSRVYPTTCFTTAPLPVILDCLQELGMPPVAAAHAGLGL
ncbi:hypothetical protein BCR44DRAFT_123687 [Catenaria anguillulae PL171]|uniref:Uncharacterized protein n=1 Tax=Catenaria anguillulae PL171 TaxID=765915 RepID=A0A1Y2I1M8_9FUNG|nr:hypothetical protein BCR44DRAFT_123687 [Catenaria anguillulae PL171]